MESQYRVATTKLAGDLEEQAVLEQILEESKPPLDSRNDKGHYLLITPFRYPPLRHGSRFGARHQRGIFYASREIDTALAETAYYRLVFLAGTEAELGPVETQHTLFRIEYDGARGIDLTAPPFVAHRWAISAPDRYDASQALGQAMRDSGVTAFRFHSARRTPGVNVGLYSPRAIKSAEPLNQQSWALIATHRQVTAIRRTGDQRLQFPRSAFLVNGALPAPAL